MITATSTTLLLGLRDAHNSRIWGVFFSRYQPLLISFGRRLGLTEDQAHDAAQEALLAFAEGYRQGRYDPSKGRLRTWLMGIATNKIRDVQRRCGREIALGGQDSRTDLAAHVRDEHSMSEIWEEEWRNAVLAACMEEVRRQVRPLTMRAFELFVLKDWPAEKVASQLGVSRDQIYTYKSRVLKRLQEIRKDLEENW